MNQPLKTAQAVTAQFQPTTSLKRRGAEARLPGAVARSPERRNVGARLALEVVHLQVCLQWAVLGSNQ